METMLTTFKQKPVSMCHWEVKDSQWIVMTLSICFFSKNQNNVHTCTAEIILFNFLRHADPKAVENARSLALSLVGTLQQDFVQWQQQQAQLQQQQQQQQQQHHHHQQQQQQQQQSQQQQSQQQVVYTFTQPYYGG